MVVQIHGCLEKLVSYDFSTGSVDREQNVPFASNIEYWRNFFLKNVIQANEQPPPSKYQQTLRTKTTYILFYFPLRFAAIGVCVCVWVRCVYLYGIVINICDTWYNYKRYLKWLHWSCFFFLVFCRQFSKHHTPMFSCTFVSSVKPYELYVVVCCCEPERPITWVCVCVCGRPIFSNNSRNKTWFPPNIYLSKTKLGRKWPFDWAHTQ